MNQTIRMPRRALALAAASSAVSGLAGAQPAWPAQPVRIAVPTAPGTSPDIAARLYAEGLAARCFLHETDHCDGLLFIDRLTPLKRDMVKKRFQKLKKRR